MRRREFLRMVAVAAAAPALVAPLAAKGARAAVAGPREARGTAPDACRAASYPRDMHAEGQPYTPLRPTA